MLIGAPPQLAAKEEASKVRLSNSEPPSQVSSVGAFCWDTPLSEFGEQPSKSLDSISIEYSMPILCDEDQVYVHCEDTSVCRGKRVDVLPWSNYDTSVLRVQGYQFEALPNGGTTSQPATLCRFVPLRL